MNVIIFLLFLMLIVLIISMLVGVFMFCIDIWKWSKRPEKFTTVEEDLKEVEVKEVIHNE